MGNNPVQIILNSSDYLATPVVLPGGGNKDFYADLDDQFRSHKTKISRQLNVVRESLMQSKYGGAGYIKVSLRKDAIAKSHRPTRSLFNNAQTPCVGGGTLGTLFFEVTPLSLSKIIGKIDATEEITRWKINPSDGKSKPNPSVIKSELGAIEDTELIQASDRRSFSAKEALNWFKEEHAAEVYFVDLFSLPKTEADLKDFPEGKRQLFDSFIMGLNQFGVGVELYPALLEGRNSKRLAIRITNGEVRPKMESLFTKRPDRRDDRDASIYDIDRHQGVLAFLDEHPLVRSVTLPPIVLKSDPLELKNSIGAKASFPKREGGVSYPTVGIIDGGVSDVLIEWKISDWDILDDSQKNTGHGSFIAGLMVAGEALGNHSLVVREADGCDIYDISIFPESNFTDYFPLGFDDFLDECALAINDARENYGVRVFNMSLNLVAMVEEDTYSHYASRIDEIARDLDVIIVISAGNLNSNRRPQWAADPGHALAQLAAHNSPDIIYQPSESVSAIAVGAINCPDTPDNVSGAPTTYTRRGPGLRVGVKPDVAHYGGSDLTKHTLNHNGLFSIDASGNIVSGMGTSYAAPLVSKTIASLISKIEGDMPRDALQAMLIHYSSIPEALNHKVLGNIPRQFVGFGVPASADEMLYTNDDAITLIFSSTLLNRKIMSFEFSWPECLVDTETGKCSGNANMTLAYQPPLNKDFGAEFVRVNLDAHLRQLNPITGGWKGQLNQFGLASSSDDSYQYESELIKHGLKWWPVKTYQKNSWRGVGKSSQWKLSINAIKRDSEPFPDEGIPFTVILTISDHRNKGELFTSFRQWLAANAVQCGDVRTAMRARTRA